MLFVTQEIQIPMNEIHFEFVRSSGPGGQNVNKVNSKAQLRWSFWASKSLPEGARTRFLDRFGSRLTKLGEVVLQSDRFRDQHRNLEDCLEKLRVMLFEIAYPPKPRKKTQPSRSTKRKNRESKTRQGDKKRGRSQKNWD